MTLVASATNVVSTMVPFFLPMKRIVERVGRAFDGEHAIVRVRGFPIKVFCLRHPDHIAALFRAPGVGDTKYPGIMPRVKWVMGAGGYIQEGGQAWRDVRAQVRSHFKRDALAPFLPRIGAFVSEMLDSWQTHAARGETFDGLKALQLLIARVNLDMYFSKEIPADELRAVQEHTHFIDLHFVRPDPLWLPLPSNRHFRRSVQAMRELVLGEIVARRAAGKTGGDVLGHLLEQTRPDTGEPWSDEQLVGEMFSIYFGASVMSTTLAWALYLIGSHPEIQEQIAREARGHLGGRTPTLQDLEALKWSQWALKEVLRLFPPSWGYPRYCRDGMEIAGAAIPPHSLVIPMVYLTQRDPALWENSEDFLPERFDTSSRPAPHPYAFLPFGAGTRTCLGAVIAPLIMQLILVQIAQRYQFRFDARFPGDPVPTFGFEIHPTDEVRIRIQPRASSPDPGPR